MLRNASWRVWPLLAIKAPKLCSTQDQDSKVNTPLGLTRLSRLQRRREGWHEGGEICWQVAGGVEWICRDTLYKCMTLSKNNFLNFLQQLHTSSNKATRPNIPLSHSLWGHGSHFLLNHHNSFMSQCSPPCYFIAEWQEGQRYLYRYLCQYLNTVLGVRSTGKVSPVGICSRWKLWTATTLHSKLLRAVLKSFL